MARITIKFRKVGKITVFFSIICLFLSMKELNRCGNFLNKIFHKKDKMKIQKKNIGFVATKVHEKMGED